LGKLRVSSGELKVFFVIGFPPVSSIEVV